MSEGLRSAGIPAEDDDHRGGTVVLVVSLGLDHRGSQLLNRPWEGRRNSREAGLGRETTALSRPEGYVVA